MSKLTFLIDAKKFSGELAQDGLAWVQAYPYDTWSHPYFTDTTIDRDVALQMKANFDANIIGHDVVIDFEHGLDPAKGKKAAGWVKAMDVREDGLYFGVKFTDTAKQEITNEEWKYFSTEHYDDWKHPHSNQDYKFVVGGGALTNKPWVKGMKNLPVNFSEVVVEKKELEATEDNDKAAGEPNPGGGEPDPIKHDDDRKAPGTVGGDKDMPEPEPRAKADTEGKEEPVVDIEAKLREILNLPEGDIFEAVEGLKKEVEPLRAAAKQHSQAKAFSEMYPQEYKRMQELEKTDRENKAKRFAESYLEFTDSDGKKLNRGFSRVVVDKIENVHKMFSEGKATQSDLADVLNAIGTTGIVEYGEIGTSVDSTEPATTGSGAKQFADAVVAIQEEDKVDFNTAVEMAASKHPKLFSAYQAEVAI